MGWVVISGRILYGMFVSEEDAREVQRRVGGELMTSEQYADYAAEQNEEIRKSALYYESDYGEV